MEAQPKVGFYKVPELKTKGVWCRSYVVTDEELRREEVQREVEPLRVESFLAGEIADRYEPLKSSHCRYGQVPLMVTHQGQYWLRSTGSFVRERWGRYRRESGTDDNLQRPV
jgi:hypothetical protein